jgi:hypothetical protein
VIHEKANLNCDCGNLDCSSCHPRWNERGYCPTDPAQYQVAGFPITPLQMLALQPSAKIAEQQRRSPQLTMDASRRLYPDFGLAKSGW